MWMWNKWRKKLRPLVGWWDLCERLVEATFFPLNILKYFFKSFSLQVVKEFLKGEYCLYGGSGWWKYEFCYGKKVSLLSSHVADQTVQSIMPQVDQYHEEAGGQRTVVRLGEFQRWKWTFWILNITTSFTIFTCHRTANVENSLDGPKCHPSNARARWPNKCYAGRNESLGRLLLLRSILFYCLRLPIHPLLEGGEPNDILGVTKVLGLKAASQQTLFIVSGSPSIQY